jgi:hypothetical protein
MRYEKGDDIPGDDESLAVYGIMDTAGIHNIIEVYDDEKLRDRIIEILNNLIHFRP